jgi:hypothetical protein
LSAIEDKKYQRRAADSKKAGQAAKGGQRVIIINDYPILEYSTQRQSVINPKEHPEPPFPDDLFLKRY